MRRSAPVRTAPIGRSGQPRRDPRACRAFATVPRLRGRPICRLVSEIRKTRVRSSIRIRQSAQVPLSSQATAPVSRIGKWAASRAN